MADRLEPRSFSEAFFLGMAEALKEKFNQAAAEELADQILSVWPEFDRSRFLAQATCDLEALEMKERWVQFADALAETIPGDFEEAVAILLRSLPPPKLTSEDQSEGWIQGVISHFISVHGLEHYETSIVALTELTMRFSAEFAIRPFADRYQERVLADLLKLSGHENVHVRRWCSEGIRPLLPWGMKLKSLAADPVPALPILNRLYRDSDLYVRRSVANFINDISKNQPELAVETCQRWQDQNSSPETAWVIRHGLRTLIKNGDSEALALMGFGNPEKLVARFSISSEKVQIGGQLELCLELQSDTEKDQKLVIDFAVYYLRKNGGWSRKVFKWKSYTHPGKTTITLRKSHKFHLTTTRALYPGPHKAELLINGETYGEVAYELIMD